MLLVIDVGNTNIVVGLYRAETLVKSWRLGTRQGMTCDEYGILIKELLAFSGIDAGEIADIIVSSVVPPLDRAIGEMSQRYFGVKPMVVGPGLKSGLPILYENPREVGADRIVNSVAALRRYGPPVIVVDFGTATTFDLVNEKGEYVGGVIAPGVDLAMEALFMKASKLPRIDLARPPKVIGRNTVHSIQSGILFGYVSLVDGIVARMKAEAGVEAKVIATGGLAGLISGESDAIDEVVEDLTLEGLRELYLLNKGTKR